jgi:dienelactone hydrolase
MNKILFLIVFISTMLLGSTKKIIEFKSLDNTVIVADLYLLDEDVNRPMIVLFHQAGWSRGEYNEIAPRLNKLGYSCMAVDLRSGGEVNDVKNQTHLNAKKSNKKTGYLNSRIDMIASFQKARIYSNKLIGWGSSYSASLLIKTVGEKPRYTKAILAFSPGEYFEKFGKSNDYISSSAKKLKIPIFITSSKFEKNSWQNIYNSIDKKYFKFFIPKSDGNHGSRALWSKFEDSDKYWDNVENFLKKLNLK